MPTGSPPLTLERYAQVLAYKREGRLTLDAVLTELDIPEADWSASRTAWVDSIEAEQTRSENELVLRFAETFSAERERIRRDRAERSIPAAAPAPVPAAAPVPVSLPTYLQRTSQVATAPFDPSVRASAVPLPSALDETGDALPAVREPVLPFGTTPSSSFVAEMSVPSPLRAESSRIDDTASLPALKKKPRTLPFVLGTDIPAAGVASSPPAAAAARASVDAQAIERRAISAGDQGRPMASQSSRFDNAVCAGFTLEQYASLSAELSVAPEAMNETLKRYGTSREAKQILDREWGARIAADVELRSQWESLVVRFRQWSLMNKK